MKKVRSIYFVFLVIIACSSCKGNNAPISQQSPFDYIVSKDGSGDFTSVQQAIDSVSSYNTKRTYIYVKNGRYKEVLRIPENKTNVTLIGESKNNVVLTYDNAANKINPESGEKYGTSGSSSTYIHGDGFVARNITFENSAGFKRNGGKDYGQTLAIYIDSDQCIFDNCRFLSGQDTFYADDIRAYVTDSYIEGTTDFIFGSAKIVFDNTEIHSYGGTAITAANTKEYVDYGFVFNDCKVTTESGVETTLGRPWRGYAAVAFLNCDLSDGIKPEGWINWHDTDRYKTARYVEYNNSGPGAAPSQRVEWAHILKESSEASNYEMLNVLKAKYEKSQSVDNWDPQKVLRKINDAIKE